MVKNENEEKSRESIPDFSLEKEFDFSGFADGLLSDMGFSSQSSTATPSPADRSVQSAPVVPAQPAPAATPRPAPAVQTQPAPAAAFRPAPVVPAQPAPDATPRPAPAVQAQPGSVATPRPAPAVQTQPAPAAPAAAFRPAPAVQAQPGSVAAPRPAPAVPVQPSSIAAPSPSQPGSVIPQQAPIRSEPKSAVAVPRTPVYVPVAPKQVLSEPEPDKVKRASGKRRIELVPATRGDHIRFIIVVVAILLFEMIFIGILSSKGVLNIGLFD